MTRAVFKDSIVSKDPFDISVRPTPAQKSWGMWFRDLVSDFPEDQPFHIRQIHYKSLGILKPNGEPYENTTSDSALLSNASIYARYLGYVDERRFHDKKNIGVVTKTVYLRDTVDINNNLSTSINQVKLLDDVSDLFTTFDDNWNDINFDVQSRQPYHLELWIEKSTMNHILQKVCNRYGMTFVVASGQMSLTLVTELYNRIETLEKPKPIRIFYLRDFDPAGEAMAIAMSRKLEWYIRKNNSDVDVKVIDIGLNHYQCKKYKLPRTPMDKKDENYSAGFQERYGQGATELDALEAIYPGKLKEMVMRFVDKYYDHNLESDIRQVEEQILNDVTKINDSNIRESVEKHGELQVIFERYNKHARRMNKLRDKVLNIAGESRYRNFDLDIYWDEFTSDILVDETGKKNVVYDTKLSYTQQLDKYRKKQGMSRFKRRQKQRKRRTR